MDIGFIFSTFHGIVCATGMFFNLLLIYLALYKSPQVIKCYSTLIVNFALTDFFACFFDFFVQQRIIPVGIGLAYFSNGFCKYFGPYTCYVGYCLMLHFFSHSLWSLLFSFSYRYYILFHPSPKRSSLIIILILIYIPSFFQFVSFLWATDDQEKVISMLETRFPTYNLEGKTISGIENIVCFSALFTILHMTLPITPVYICILYLRRKIIQRLSFKGITVTTGTKNIHAQLLMALTFQAIIPGFYLFAVLSYSIGQLGIYNHPALEYFTFSCIVLIPVLSPLSSFFFVAPYRNFILQKIYRRPIDTIEGNTSTNQRGKQISESHFSKRVLN